MDGVPGGIDPGDFVGEEFDHIHCAGGGNYPGVFQYLKAGWQVHRPGRSHDAKHGTGGIQVQATGPGGTHRQGD